MTGDERWRVYENEMWALGLDYYETRIRNLGAQRGSLLDLGCGPGQWSAAAKNIFPRVIGCDKRIGGKVLTLKDTPGFGIVQASADHLPFQDETFHAVLCELVLPYVDVERCVAEVTRVMKPRGILHGIGHGPGYYLRQAFLEARRIDLRAFRRRLIVLVYTLLHRTLRLRKYFYETFQTKRGLEHALRNAGLEVLFLEPGGHPIMKESRFLGFITFYEFVARKG